MRTVERDLDRILAALRHRIRERGFTQLEVQEVMGWGRSYISQLLTKQKSIRIDQVLQILRVIGLDPGEFWAEVFQFCRSGEISDRGGTRRGPAAPLQSGTYDSMRDGVHRIQILLDAVVTVLVQKELITAGEFEAAVSRRETGETPGDPVSPFDG